MNMIIMIRSSIIYPLKIQTMQLQVVNLQGWPRLRHLSGRGTLSDMRADLHVVQHSTANIILQQIAGLQVRQPPVL